MARQLRSEESPSHGDSLGSTTYVSGHIQVLTFMIQTIDLNSCAATKKVERPPCGSVKGRFRARCHGASITGRRSWSYRSQLPSSLFTINGPWELKFYVTVVIAAKLRAGFTVSPHSLSTCLLMTCKTKCFSSRSALSNTAFGIHVADACWGSIVSWELPSCFRLRRS